MVIVNIYEEKQDASEIDFCIFRFHKCKHIFADSLAKGEILFIIDTWQLEVLLLLTCHGIFDEQG